MKHDDKNDYFLCPSAPLTQNAFLFGVLDDQAKVKYTDHLIPVTEELFENIDSPEKNFRFTMKCGDSACAQWENGKCSVASALKESDATNLDLKASKCAIKKACRWFTQEGISACRLCKFIVTDLSK